MGMTETACLLNILHRYLLSETVRMVKRDMMSWVYMLFNDYFISKYKSHNTFRILMVLVK